MNAIKQRRIKLGLTQFQLAKLTNIAPAQISRYETGRTKPCGHFILVRLAEALEISIEELTR